MPSLNFRLSRKRGKRKSSDNAGRTEHIPVAFFVVGCHNGVDHHAASVRKLSRTAAGVGDKALQIARRPFVLRPLFQLRKRNDNGKPACEIEMVGDREASGTYRFSETAPPSDARAAPSGQTLLLCSGSDLTGGREYTCWNRDVRHPHELVERCENGRSEARTRVSRERGKQSLSRVLGDAWRRACLCGSCPSRRPRCTARSCLVSCRAGM